MHVGVLADALKLDQVQMQQRRQFTDNTCFHEHERQQTTPDVADDFFTALQ